MQKEALEVHTPILMKTKLIFRKKNLKLFKCSIFQCISCLNIDLFLKLLKLLSSEQICVKEEKENLRQFNESIKWPILNIWEIKYGRERILDERVDAPITKWLLTRKHRFWRHSFNTLPYFLMYLLLIKGENLIKRKPIH